MSRQKGVKVFIAHFHAFKRSNQYNRVIHNALVRFVNFKDTFGFLNLLIKFKNEFGINFDSIEPIFHKWGSEVNI